MSKIHYDPSLNLEAHIAAMLVGEVPLHKTAYANGGNGIESTNHVELVDCAICLRKMNSK